MYNTKAKTQFIKRVYFYCSHFIHIYSLKKKYQNNVLCLTCFPVLVRARLAHSTALFESTASALDSASGSVLSSEAQAKHGQMSKQPRAKPELNLKSKTLHNFPVVLNLCSSRTC